MATWNELFLNSKYRMSAPQFEVYKFIRQLEGIFPDHPLAIWDLCCGTGRNTTLIAEMGHIAYGSDISENGIKFTQALLEKQGVEGTLKVSDMTEYPFGEKKLQGIFSWNALHHNTLENIKKAVDIVYEALVEQGLFMVTLMSTRSEGFGIGREIETGTFVQDDGEEAGVPHHYFTEQEVRDLFSKFEMVILSEQVANYIKTEEKFYEMNPFHYTKWAILVRKKTIY